MPADPITELFRLHDAAHVALDQRFFFAIEALTELCVGDPGSPAANSALGHWSALMHALRRHHEAEEAAFEGHLADIEGPPRGASERIYLPEHRQLEHLLVGGYTLLVALAEHQREPDFRGRMVRSLEPLWRVHHLLSHHYARERDIIYPWALPRLGHVARDTLASTLRAAGV